MKHKIIGLCLVVASVLVAAPVDVMIGSRGYSMGGAYCAIADDASAAYWNPAGLGKIENLTIMESNWIMQDVEGLNINYFSAAYPLKNIATFSGSWLLTHANLEEGWDDEKGEVEKVNSANDHQFSLSVGRNLWDTLAFFSETSIGLSFNRYTLSLSDDSEDEGAGLGFDVGAQLGLPAGFALGFTARYIGSEIMGVKIDPELRWGLGFSRVLREMHRVTVDIDAALKHNRDYTNLIELAPGDRNFKVLGGVEYGLIINDFEIDISGGINTMQHNTRGIHNFAFGAGFVFKKHAIRYAFGSSTDADYSLGNSHRITISIALGELLGI
jgi:hypothetical protein